jgi:hypothetical protein
MLLFYYFLGMSVLFRFSELDLFITLGGFMNPPVLGSSFKSVFL